MPPRVRLRENTLGRVKLFQRNAGSTTVRPPYTSVAAHRRARDVREHRRGVPGALPAPPRADAGVARAAPPRARAASRSPLRPSRSRRVPRRSLPRCAPRSRPCSSRAGCAWQRRVEHPVHAGRPRGEARRLARDRRGLCRAGAGQPLAESGPSGNTVGRRGNRSDSAPRRRALLVAASPRVLVNETRASRDFRRVHRRRARGGLSSPLTESLVGQDAIDRGAGSPRREAAPQILDETTARRAASPGGNTSEALGRWGTGPMVGAVPTGASNSPPTCWCAFVRAAHTPRAAGNADRPYEARGRSIPPTASPGIWVPSRNAAFPSPRRGPGVSSRDHATVMEIPRLAAPSARTGASRGDAAEHGHRPHRRAGHSIRSTAAARGDADLYYAVPAASPTAR